MVELVARSACAGLLPIEVGDLTLSEADPGQLTSIAPFAGAGKHLAKALKAAHGLDWPQPDAAREKAGARLIWFGRDMALLAGPAPDPSLGQHAALTDQTDAWAAVTLTGASVEDVLARFVPVDLRARSFPVGHTVRSLLGHMNASITRSGADSFLILVFRSMAGTLVHELHEAMQGVSARG